MKIIAQVSWYDEPIESLERLILSMRGLVDAALFMDGAYKSFPHNNPVSPNDQYVAIIRACIDADIMPIIPPGRLWPTQTDKRSTMFAITEFCATTFADYTLIIDADEHLTLGDDPRMIRAVLADSRPDAALVTLNTPPPNMPRSQYQRRRGIHMPQNSTKRHGKGIPRIFRILEDVTVGPKHHGSYVGRREDGELICLKDRSREYAWLEHKATVLDMKDIVTITNETWKRDRDRIQAKHIYGKTRTRLRQDL